MITVTVPRWHLSLHYSKIHDNARMRIKMRRDERTGDWGVYTLLPSNVRHWSLLADHGRRRPETLVQGAYLPSSSVFCRHSTGHPLNVGREPEEEIRLLRYCDSCIDVAPSSTGRCMFTVCQLLVLAVWFCFLASLSDYMLTGRCHDCHRWDPRCRSAAHVGHEALLGRSLI